VSLLISSVVNGSVSVLNWSIEWCWGVESSLSTSKWLTVHIKWDCFTHERIDVNNFLSSLGQLKGSLSGFKIQSCHLSVDVPVVSSLVPIDFVFDLKELLELLVHTLSLASEANEG
jgi:hypothetical protein